LRGGGEKFNQSRKECNPDYSRRQPLKFLCLRQKGGDVTVDLKLHYRVRRKHPGKRFGCKRGVGVSRLQGAFQTREGNTQYVLRTANNRPKGGEKGTKKGLLSTKEKIEEPGRGRIFHSQGDVTAKWEEGRRGGISKNWRGGTPFL